MSDDYYALLELDRNASADEIRTAIREQRRVWVRRQSSPDPDRRTLAEQRVRDLDAAEKMLLDAGARAGYDRQLGSGTGRSGGADRTGGIGSAGPPDRSGPSARRASPPSPTPPSPTPSNAASSRTVGGTAAASTPDGQEDRRGQAERYLAAEKYRQAAAEYEALLAAVPSDNQAKAGLGECYLHIERVDEGLAMLKELVGAEPANGEFRLIYAYGLYQQAWDGLAEVSDGRLAMSRRQVGLLRRNEREIGALGIDDPQVQGWRSQLSSLLQDATRRRKLPSYRKRYYLGGVVVALVIALAGPTQLYQVIGALFLAFIGWLYVHRHRPPMWQVRRKQFRRQTLQRGI